MADALKPDGPKLTPEEEVAARALLSPEEVSVFCDLCRTMPPDLARYLGRSTTRHAHARWAAQVRSVYPTHGEEVGSVALCGACHRATLLRAPYTLTTSTEHGTDTRYLQDDVVGEWLPLGEGV